MLELCFAFFAGFKQDSPPGFLRDPLGYPRQPYDVKLRVFEPKKKKV
jgi:hypothetical protein